FLKGLAAKGGVGAIAEDRLISTDCSGTHGNQSQKLECLHASGHPPRGAEDNRTRHVSGSVVEALGHGLEPMSTYAAVSVRGYDDFAARGLNPCFERRLLSDALAACTCLDDVNRMVSAKRAYRLHRPIGRAIVDHNHFQPIVRIGVSE